jgi:sulfur relay protein TusB/DsrH
MVEILHVIKSHGDKIAFDIIKEQVKSRDVAVLLIQDGVLEADTVDMDVEIYASKSDVEARGIKTGVRLLHYEDVVELIFDSEKVVCW